MFYKLLKISTVGFICILMSACGGNATSPDTSTPPPSADSTLASPKEQRLSWQAPTQRMNGDNIDSKELVSYEIWAGYSPNALFWVHTHLPTDIYQDNLSIDLAKTLQLSQNQGLSPELNSYKNETLFFGIIAIDAEGNRSMMSKLKAISVQL